MTREELEQRLEDLNEALDELEDKRDEFYLDPDDYTDEFDKMLNGNNPKFFGHYPSYVLKEVDPIQYHEELSNYVDSMDKEDDPGYRNLVKEIGELEEEIQDLEEELENLEDEDED